MDQSLQAVMRWTADLPAALVSRHCSQRVFASLPMSKSMRGLGMEEAATMSAPVRVVAAIAAAAEEAKP